MHVPTNPLSMMLKIYRHVIPAVKQELQHWQTFAEQIPDLELRKQALASLDHKDFHCEGGGILALLTKENFADCIQFIVAYQTISDYLDNLCDRSTSMDADDFAMLHQAMTTALSPSMPCVNFYQYRDEQDDGGYLDALVKTCQEALSKTKHFAKIQPLLLKLASIYCDLQVHKHVQVSEREARLKSWFSLQYDDAASLLRSNSSKPIDTDAFAPSGKANIPEMTWFEFSACAGSTLAIFCLVAYAFEDAFTIEQANSVLQGYFPNIQGLHILLDYLIDQEEDRLGGDLNFCNYYESELQLETRLKHFITEAKAHSKQIPNSKFHQLICQGLVGIYLSDQKASDQSNIKRIIKVLNKQAGAAAYFFYINGKAFRFFKKPLKALSSFGR